MGAGSSSHPKYDAAVSVFNDKEREIINGIFEDFSEGERTVIEMKFHNSHLKQHLPSILIKRLYDATCHVLTENQCKGDLAAGFDVQSFTVMVAYSLKGTIDQRGHLLTSLAKKNSKGKDITSGELTEAVAHLLTSYMKMMVATKEFQTWNVAHKPESDEKMVRFLLKDIATPDEPLQILGSESIEGWLSKSAFVTHMMDYIFFKCFPVSFVDDVSELRQCIPKVPRCQQVDWDASHTLLDLSSLVFLNHSIPSDHSRHWRLLFSSRTHGESFSTMLKHIRSKGPSLVIVQDREGHVFGGFSSESWELKPNFYGSASCFLFTLSPCVGRYYPTGVNENYVYLNYGQQTLPNGLGFGGQFEYFGLFLDDEYGHGHSKAEPTCSTYVSPRLSANEKFEFVHLEVWGVGEAPETEENKTGSILDEDPGAKAMLSLIGKGPVSEGLRESDPVAETPEEHELPPL